MTQREAGDGYYERLHKQQKDWSIRNRANHNERDTLRDAFSKAASAEDKEKIEEQLDANWAASRKLQREWDKIRDAEQNPPWIELSKNLLYANYAKVEELTRDGVFIKMMNEERVSLLGQPAYAGDTKIAKLLIERGANIETSGGELSETPLQTSVYKDSVGVFKLLVKAGADTTVRNAAGQSLREMAKEYGADDILVELDKMDRKAKKAAPKLPGPK